MNTLSASVSAEDIGRRVLALIDSIRGPEQIDAAHIQRVTGQTVEFNDADPNQYGFGGNLDGDWTYNLVSLTELDDSRPHRLMFSFDDGSDDGNADMGPICTMDYAAYDRALTAAGFTAAPMRGRHGQIEYWEYQRGPVSLQVYVRGENDAKADHTCVSMIIVNA
jgi:hypothetical protein